MSKGCNTLECFTLAIVTSMLTNTVGGMKGVWNMAVLLDLHWKKLCKIVSSITLLPAFDGAMPGPSIYSEASAEVSPLTT